MNESFRDGVLRCSTTYNFALIKVQDHGQKLLFRNDRRLNVTIVCYDGCVKIHEIAADKIVLVQGLGSIIVEFKGRDVEHATLQVLTSAQEWVSGGMHRGRIAGMIVCRQFPAMNTYVRKAQERFARQFRGLLHVHTGFREHKFEVILRSLGD